MPTVKKNPIGERESGLKCEGHHTSFQPQMGRIFFSPQRRLPGKKTLIVFCGLGVPFAITDLAYKSSFGLSPVGHFFCVVEDAVKAATVRERPGGVEAERRAFTASGTKLSLSNGERSTQREAVRPNSA